VRSLAPWRGEEALRDLLGGRIELIGLEERGDLVAGVLAQGDVLAGGVVQSSRRPSTR
jgi:hypothetical protein